LSTKGFQTDFFQQSSEDMGMKKFQIDSFQASHLGLNRKTSEDCSRIESSLRLYITADGVSSPAGAWASKTACEIVERHIIQSRAVIAACESSPSSQARQQVARILVGAVNAASLEIFQEIQKDPQKRGVFTTLDALLLVDSFAFIAHVGDGRVYLYREPALEQMTRDHTYYQALIDTSAETPESAAKRPFAQNLTRALGLSPNAQVDLLQVELAPGDRLLMTTDGLTDRIGDLQMISILQEKRPSKDLCQRLIESALGAQSSDNITAVVVDTRATEDETRTAIAVRKMKAMRALPFFEVLSNDELRKLLAISDMRGAAAGDTLVKHGDTGNEMFVVLDGTVEIELPSSHTITRPSGSLIGEMGVFDGLPRSATVKASTECSLLKIGKKDLFQLMREEPQIGLKLQWGVIQALSSKLRGMDTPDALHNREHFLI